MRFIVLRHLIVVVVPNNLVSPQLEKEIADLVTEVSISFLLSLFFSPPLLVTFALAHSPKQYEAKVNKRSEDVRSQSSLRESMEQELVRLRADLATARQELADAESESRTRYEELDRQYSALAEEKRCVDASLCS